MINFQQINFDKGSELIPAIIQDYQTKNVLMLGYMNKESLEKTITEGRVCFYSRSKKRLWTKGESSGNYLEFIQCNLDCDSDSLLIQVNPTGPVCHTGSDTCWNQNNTLGYGFISELEKTISDRMEKPSENSYIASLFEKGLNKIAQKVGEEAVELVIEAKDDDANLFKNEAADLFFHYLILLKAKGNSLDDILQILQDRRK